MLPLSKKHDYSFAPRAKMADMSVILNPVGQMRLLRGMITG